MRTKILILGLIFLILIHCKSPTSPEAPKKNPPVINSFTASPTEINRGESLTLSWNVTGATSVEIDQGIGTVSASGTKSISPTSTTIYNLTAKNEGGTATKSCTVIVKAIPIILKFTATPSSIKYGESSTLAWEVQDTTIVEISPGIGSVSASGSRAVSPTSTTTYTLTARNSEGESSKTCTISVQSVAKVIMTEGPIFIDGYSIFEYKGIVKNIGNKEARWVKIYIYIRKTDSSLITFEYTYADTTHITPGTTSAWNVLFWDSNGSIRKSMDKSKTTYEIKWDE